MPNPIEVSNMFVRQMPDPREDRQRMMQDIQGMEVLKGIHNKNTLGMILANRGKDYAGAAEEYAAAGGDPQGVLDLQERARREHERAQSDEERGLRMEDREKANTLRDIQLMGEAQKVAGELRGITPGQYPAWKARYDAIHAALGQQSNAPAEYDEAWITQERAAAKPFIDKIGKHDFLVDPTKGSYTQIKPTTTHGMLSPEQAAALGLPAGGAYQADNTGKVSAVVKPPTAGRGGVADAQQLMALGLAPTMQDAMVMSNMSKGDPVELARIATKTEIDAAVAMGMQPPSWDAVFPKKLEAAQGYYRSLYGNGQAQGAPPPPPTAVNPQTGERVMFVNGAWVPAQAGPP